MINLKCFAIYIYIYIYIYIAYIHGGSRLHIHIAFLFNLFARYSYVPSHFMKCIIVPLVKCKTGDLSDVNNYK
jgi:hypothetical protein